MHDIGIPRSLIACSLLLAGCYSSNSLPVAAVWTERHPLDLESPPPRIVEIWAHRGHVLVRDGEELEGSVAIDVRAATRELAREQAQSAQLIRSTDGGRLRLEVSHAEGADLDAVSVRCQLNVPPYIRVVVRTKTAQIALRGYRGEVDASSDSGTISARPGGGNLQLSTLTGAIRLSGDYESARLDTQSGTIGVAVPPASTDVRLEINSRDGPVTVDMERDCKMLLSYTTRAGQLRSEFPVRWETNGQNTEDGHKLYAGLLGELDCPSQVEAIVTQDTGLLEVRRRPTGGVALPDEVTRAGVE